MAKRVFRSLITLAVLAAAVQSVFPSLLFTGVCRTSPLREAAVARAARVDPRGQDSYELWIQHPSTALNYRVLVDKFEKMSDVKVKAIEKLGLDFDFLKVDDFSLAPNGKGSENAFQESKTVKDCDLLRDDVVDLWFNGVIA
mmetsp:Transcript_35182/g.80535  ORF Transcript_35182/g.80535 Transcript_35182/m.80535 type:complete len:142 (+) Transcript_35182:76-501(+)|eukprot:1164052-Amphidinium_carterae.1